MPQHHTTLNSRSSAHVSEAQFTFRDHNRPSRRRHFVVGILLVVGSISLALLAGTVEAHSTTGNAIAAGPWSGSSWAFGLLVAMIGMWILSMSNVYLDRSSRSPAGQLSTGSGTGSQAGSARTRPPGPDRSPESPASIIPPQDFNHSLEEHWTGCRSQSCFLGLIAVQIDDFGALTDAFGQLNLENRILSMAHSLGSLVEARGGLLTHEKPHRFLVLFPNTTPDDVLEIAEDLRLAVEDLSIALPPPDRGVVTVSVGSCFTVPVAEAGVGHFVTTTRRALQRARERGGNRIETRMLEDQLLIRS